MKIKFLTLLLTICLTPFFAVSQQNSCVNGFSFETYTDTNPNININDIVIEWDFSGVENREDFNLVIEIQPLDNCWEELNGTLRSSLVEHKIKDLSNNISGNIRVEHLRINAKCFKWRAVISKKSDSCKKSTAWEFKAFL